VTRAAVLLHMENGRGRESGFPRTDWGDGFQVVPSSAPDTAAVPAGVPDSIGAVYDHTAHAVPSIRAVLPLYCDVLGGRAVAGGINPWGGHLGVHFAFPGGKIELLEPVQEDSPAIGSFLRASPRGGLHHVTFKVEDLEVALSAVQALGITPIGVRLEPPEWRECFLHPRQTGGVLLQLVQAAPNVPPPLAGTLEDLLAEADEVRARNGFQPHES
jgi:methylmalonyl-CoA/ethylmalonyl-CoA epimerase